MIGEAFEVSRVDDRGEITHFARTLDRIDGVYHQLMILNGECMSRDESPNVIYFTQGDYGHCTLGNDEDGVLSFTPLPYRPDQYPHKDINEFSVYRNDAEGKLWAIAEINNELHTCYQNDQTNGRLVYQKVECKKPKLQRIDEKILKGYRHYSSVGKLCTKTRHFFY